MYCNKCGYKYDGNFCPKCGAKAKQATKQDATYTPQQTNSSINEENPYAVYYEQFKQQDFQPQATVQPTPQQPQQINNNLQDFCDNNFHYPPTQENIPQNIQQEYYQQYQHSFPPQPTTQQRGKVNPWKVVSFILIGVLSYIFIVSIFSSITYDNFSSFEKAQPNSQYYIGETAETGDFSYTLTETNILEEYDGHKPQAGFELVEVTFEIVNTSRYSEYMDFSLSCYVDDIMCNEIMGDDTYYYADNELLPDKTYKATAVFEVPEESEVINIYIDDYSSIINFVIE